jgi:hypothetical protein
MDISMIIREQERKIVRECNIEWHCHEIVLSQPDLKYGYTLKGYGIIKSHETGGLYLDFICIDSNKSIDVMDSVPKDPLDKRQSVLLHATAINGTQICSRDLKIDSNFQQMLSNGPKLYKIYLKSIELFEERESESNESSFLQLEFSGNCRVPFNKSNTTESSLGTKSFAWNQAVIEHEGIEINIIEHEKFTEVYVKGKGLQLIELREALVFYIGFSSGLYIQPYYEYYGDIKFCKTIINSVDIKKTGKSILAPISALAYDENKKSLDHLHYELLKNILNIAKEKGSYFESIYSQWSRIWHSFLSPELSVPMLTISVAVEGILNDIFIPVIENLVKDEKFEKEKNSIKEIISSVEGVSAQHLDSIQRFIEKWGNTHAKKALQYLSEQRIVENHQVKCWEKLRNSSAHPKLLKQDEARKRKDIERTRVCLGLFYRLSLNVFSYKGAQYTYEKPKDDKMVVYEHIDILH